MKRDAILAWGTAVAVAAAILVAWGYLHAPDSTLVKVGMTAPDLELPSLGGAKARLAGYRGRPVLLVMFLSGCHICEREVEMVERLHREYLQKGLVVVGVAVDEEPTEVTAFVERHGLTFVVLLDPDGRAVREAYGSWQMPEAYLMDAGGTVRGVFLGSVPWRSPEMRDRIVKLLPRRKEPVTAGPVRPVS